MGEQAGAALAQRFMARIKAIDGTRPVTANAHNTLGQNGSILGVLDVMGLTYDQGDLDKMHAERPGAPLLNGESASCQSDRGDEDASGVIACSRDSWAPADARIWDAGAFVWSGFDYRGEVGWPAVVSAYGVLDLCGFRKPVANWYTVWWGSAAGWEGAPATVLASPAWEPPAGGAGAPVKITALAAAPFLQLLVNGVAQGARVAVPRLGFATWSVPFQPGNYTVASFASAAGGAALGAFASRTPGPAYALRAEVDWPGSGPGGALRAGGRDAALVALSVVDAAGVVVERGGAFNLTFGVEGPGELLGLGNGDHQNHNPGQGLSWVPTYGGRARALLRGAAAATGAPLRLTVAAAGLQPAGVQLEVV